MKIATPALLLATTLFYTGCRTLDREAESVAVLDRAPTGCKNLGVVNVDWGWWGTSTEALNVLRNQTAELGGNAVYLHSAVIGNAYNCVELRRQ